MIRLASFSLVVALTLVAIGNGARASVPPSALQAGSNDGIADSFVGNHDWTFAANPGPFELVISLGRVPTNALPGAPFHVVLHINPISSVRVKYAKTPGGYVYKGTVLKPIHMRLTVIPPSSMLVREANEYTVEATGNIVYGAAIDPVIGTYTGPNDYGATRFLPGGTIRTVGGETGTWSVFDPQLHIYAVTVGQNRYSLKLVPGQGLDDAGNGNIVFQSVH